MCDDNTRAFMKEHGVWNDQKLIFVIYGQPHGFKRTVLPVAMELLQTDHRQARWWLFDLRPSNRTLRWHSASTCRNLSTFSTSNRERWTRQVSTCHSLHREENRQGKLHFWQRRRCSAESVAFDRLKKRIWNFDCQFLRIITTNVKLLKSTVATSLVTWWMPINSLRWTCWYREIEIKQKLEQNFQHEGVVKDLWFNRTIIPTQSLHYTYYWVPSTL